jgi:redox-sensitive bicupin YhaK (pirin superfamily)
MNDIHEDFSMRVEKPVDPDNTTRDGAISLVIEPEIKDLGDFTVRRTLPAPGRQRVGPFIFFDHMGPADFAPGAGVGVRAHPHIGLATITYLFAGQIMHRDSLGNAQVIEKGAVNWMTAGRGIVHSERTPEELKKSGSHIHGIQAWIALPVELEETEPRFEHYPEDAVPEANSAGVRLRVIAGEAYGLSSPVRTSSETLYVEVDLEAGADLSLPGVVDELALYIVDGEVDAGGCTVAAGRMAVIQPGSNAIAHAETASKFMLLGGGTLPGERYLWWNFVSSSKERMERAKADWREKRFPDVPGEAEFIPLPKS